MLLTIKTLLLVITIITINLRLCLSDFHFEMVYWELKPFVFTNDNNKVVGIFPEIWDYVDRFCDHHQTIRPKLKLTGYKEFNKLKMDNTTNNYTTNPTLKSVDGNKALWFPDLTDSSGFKKRKQLWPTNSYSIPSISVFARRQHITLLYKISLGFYFVMSSFLLVACFAAFFAICVWCWERYSNPNIRDEFTFGSLISIWMAFVTMTTVGYGDVVAQSCLGRILMGIWMMFGLIFSSSLAAGTLDVITQTRHLDLANKTVGALNGSAEVGILYESWNFTIKAYESYEEILQGLRDGETFLAIMNSDAAAYIQDTMNQDETKEPLSIVKLIYLEVPVKNWAHSLDKYPPQDLANCMANHMDEGRKLAAQKFRRKPEVKKIHYPSLPELFKEFNMWTYSFIFGGSLIALGILFDIVTCFNCCKRKEMQSILRDMHTEYENEQRNEREEEWEELFQMGKEIELINQSLGAITEKIINQRIRTPATTQSKFLVMDGHADNMMY